MAKSTRTRLVRGKAKRETIWVTTLFSSVAVGVGAGALPNALVAAVDWARGNGFEKGAVLKAIRGAYQVGYTNTSTGTVPSWFLSIWKGEEDEDSTAHNWSTSATWNGEDVLYSDMGHIALSASPAAPAAATPWGMVPTQPLSRMLDVKTTRKLTVDDVIYLSFVTSSANNDWDISGVFRCLIQLP